MYKSCSKVIFALDSLIGWCSRELSDSQTRGVVVHRGRALEWREASGRKGPGRQWTAGSVRPEFKNKTSSGLSLVAYFLFSSRCFTSSEKWFLPDRANVFVIVCSDLLPVDATWVPSSLSYSQEVLRKYIWRLKTETFFSMPPLISKGTYGFWVPRELPRVHICVQTRSACCRQV